MPTAPAGAPLGAVNGIGPQAWSPERPRLSTTSAAGIEAVDIATGAVTLLSPTASRPPRGPLEGRAIAFRNADGQLAVLDLDDGSVRILAAEVQGSAVLRVVADRRAIGVYEGFRNDEGGLWLVRTDGSGLRLAAPGASDAHWSPDGTRL